MKELKSIKYDKVKNSIRGRMSVEGCRKAFYGKTKQEVRGKFKHYLDSFIDDKKITEKILLGEYIEYWLKHYKLNKIEPSSYARLLNLYESRIKDTVGIMYLHELSTKKIQKLIDVFAFPNEQNVTPLARSGLKKVKSILNASLKVAVKEGLINSNPCEDVVIPVEGCLAIKTKEQFSLNNDELTKFKNACLQKLNYIDEYMSRNGIVLLLLVNLGLRVGEMVALKWSDINFDDKVISINKIIQVNLRRDSGYNIETPVRVKNSSKTKNGVRSLPLTDVVKSYLQLLKEYDKRNGIESDFVACTMDGKMSHYVNLSRTLDNIKKRTGLNKNLTLHTLRHTFGSQLIRQGVSVEIVSKLLGHSSITVTYNTYIHVLQEELAKSLCDVSIC